MREEEVKAERTKAAASALATEPAIWGRRVRVRRFKAMEALSEKEAERKRVW